MCGFAGSTYQGVVQWVGGVCSLQGGARVRASSGSSIEETWNMRDTGFSGTPILVEANLVGKEALG